MDIWISFSAHDAPESNVTVSGRSVPLLNVPRAPVQLRMAEL